MVRALDFICADFVSKRIVCLCLLSLRGMQSVEKTKASLPSNVVSKLHHILLKHVQPAAPDCVGAPAHPAPHRAVSQQAAQALRGRAPSAWPVAGTAQASKRALQARQGPLQEKLCSFPPLSSVLHKWNSFFTPQLLSQYISYCALGAGSESHPFKFHQIQSED